MYFVVNGLIHPIDGYMAKVGFTGGYWSSTPFATGPYVNYLSMNNDSYAMALADGFSGWHAIEVRCLAR